MQPQSAVHDGLPGIDTRPVGAVALPKTANPDHMASNAAVDFTISSEDRETLKHTDRIADYGEFNIFPVFSGKPLA